ncbi:unnamed protein product [Caenorhabditis angaria]|uniref:Uncharacterized protein n=1 Tax=Caenorhabditis angaria TaxID=860376 RepID=A0A9P1J2T8_9PELO|nr:unnamed protein product [Caenorhabditis angaria]
MTDILTTTKILSASNRQKCPISIDLLGEELSPQSLFQAALSSSNLHLTLRSDDGQKLHINFTEDRFQSTQNNPSTSSLVSNCHFHGFTEGDRNSLSACSSEEIGGLIFTRNNRFGLAVKDGRFILTPYVIDNCNFGEPKRSKRKADIDRNPSYIKEHLDDRRRFVELALAADYSIYQKLDSDEQKVNDYMQKTINVLNSLYHPLGIRVALVYSEIWKKGNLVEVIEDSGKTLQNFHEYMKDTMRKEHLFDTGYMLTTLRFADGVVGKAYKGTMCSYDFSAGIYVDHNDDFVTTVATLAHELGHTFGMDHDPDIPDADVCYCPMPKCIMSAQSDHVEVWSECSVKNLANAFNRGVDLCLFNEPGKKPSDAVCGNHIVEAGEECDCGPIKCSNPCCDYKTCKFIGEAVCASGECCDLQTCKPKPRATVCRTALGICDLDEYCNGETSECPADFYVQNGAICPNRQKEFCYEGGCGSREDNCAKIWGETGHNADSNCYAQNTRGTFHGNCGYDVTTKVFKKCEPQNNKCGRLQCETQAERPVYGDPNRYQSSHSSVRSSNNNQTAPSVCYTFKQEILNQPDIGMVPDGAECGPDDMCIGQKCQKKSKITKVTSQCLDNCNFRGVCNNVGNCHCERGFGGIACEIPGYGGSVNSNEAYQFRGITVTSTFLVLFFFLGFFIAGLCVWYRVKKQRNLPSEWWSVVRKKFDLHGDLVPVRRAPPPPYAQRIRQSFTAMWGDHSAPPTYSPPPQIPKFDPPCIPMATFKDHEVSSPTPLLHSNPAHTAEVYPVFEKPRSDSFSRTGSLRPNFQPPPIPRPSDEALNRLREELNDEKYDKLTKPKVAPPPLPKEKPKSSTLKRNESMRPDVAPPPPPPAHTKPAIPENPPKADVKKLAAKFEQNKNCQFDAFETMPDARCYSNSNATFESAFN